MIKVRYIGDYYRFSLRKGKVYDAEIINETPDWYAIADESGEEYVFPSYIFEVIEEEDTPPV